MSETTQKRPVGKGENPSFEHMPELVVVSGMSGAGRTEAMHAFEDLGYFCVDNLPSSLIGNLLELAGMPGQPDGKRRLAVCSGEAGVRIRRSADIPTRNAQTVYAAVPRFCLGGNCCVQLEPLDSTAQF